MKKKQIILETYGSSQKYYYDVEEENTDCKQQSESKGKPAKGIFNSIKETLKVILSSWKF